MIQDNFFFDPVKDIAPVDQFGFIDLKSALATGVVPSQLPDSDSDYNGIENPEAVLGTTPVASALLRSIKPN